MPRAVIRIRKEPAYRREAIEAGLKKLGYVLTDGSRDSREWLPTSQQDLLVLWNKKAGLDEQMADTWERRGGTVIVVENAYLQKVDKSSYAISVHGHNGSGWFPVGAEDRFSRLGFELKPLAHRQGSDLVIEQRSIGSKLMASPFRWAETLAKTLRGVDVKIRQHPGNFRPKVPLEVDLASARAVHIWSSSAGVRALVEGVPVVHRAPCWICAHEGGREAALHDMAHGQWGVNEIAGGEPFARMQAADWGPKTWH